MDYSLLLGIHYRSKANVKGEYQKWHQSCLTLPLCGRPCTQLAHAARGSTSGFKRPSVHLNADDALVSVLLAAARCVPTRCLCLTCVHCWGPRTAPGANGEACPGNERKGELANHAHSCLLRPQPQLTRNTCCAVYRRQSQPRRAHPMAAEQTHPRQMTRLPTTVAPLPVPLPAILVKLAAAWLLATA